MCVTAARLIVGLSNVYRRAFGAFLGVIGPRAAYALMGWLARRCYRLLDPLRQRSEGQCRAALGAARSAAEIADIAERSFVHRCWNLADLALANRLLRRDTIERYGGAVPEPYRAMMLDAQRRRQPMLLLTAYYGPYDLLPLLLGYNGVRAAAVYRAHPNPSFDAYRQVVRSRSGCEMVRDTEAVGRLPQILENGGAVALLADHHAERRGVSATFLGLETSASRSVGLLAERYEAVVVVAGIRRREAAFRFEIEIADLFDASAWRGEEDAVGCITQRYLAGLERIVQADPAQYLWAYARWGEGLARRATDEAS